MPSKPNPCHLDFHVAMISALPLEAHAARGVFDEIYDEDGHSDKASSCGTGQAASDTNSYTKGRIGCHAVVLAHLPGMGKVNAASAASSLQLSFPELRLVLLIGICGGVPYGPDGVKIMLGDVIIGTNVVQSDFGRVFPDGFTRKDTADDNLTRPRPEIRAFIRKLEACKDDLQQRTATMLQSLLLKPQFKQSQYPGPTEDKLFSPAYEHKHRYSKFCECSQDGKICSLAKQSSCEEVGCETTYLEPRQRAQDQDQLTIHFGAVASGDAVIKSGQHRDDIALREGIIAIEMEGAGIWEHLPCIIVKGVCDYADSHKNKKWQRYAAAAASASAKAILEQWKATGRPRETGMMSSSSEMLGRNVWNNHDQTKVAVQGSASNVQITL